MTTEAANALPEARPGLLGEWDKFIGPGATRAEVALILGAGVIAALAVPVYALSHGLGWSAWQHLAAALLAADLAGGVVANAAAPAKRWYHRPGQGPRQRLVFVSVHAVYIGLVAGLFHNLDWAYFAAYTAYLLGAAWLVEHAPRNLRRPGAYALTAGAVLLNSLGLPAAPGLGWFVPLLFIKLLIAHLIPDN